MCWMVFLFHLPLVTLPLPVMTFLPMPVMTLELACLVMMFLAYSIIVRGVIFFTHHSPQKKTKATKVIRSTFH